MCFARRESPAAKAPQTAPRTRLWFSGAENTPLVFRLPRTPGPDARGAGSEGSGYGAAPRARTDQRRGRQVDGLIRRACRRRRLDRARWENADGGVVEEVEERPTGRKCRARGERDDGDVSK